MKEAKYYFGHDINRVQKDDYYTVYAYSQGSTIFAGTHDEYFVFTKQGLKHVKEIVLDHLLYENAVREYTRKIEVRRSEFKKDLFEDNRHVITLASKNVSQEKIDQCFDMAVTMCDDVFNYNQDEDYFEKIEDVFCRMVTFLS